MGTLGSLFGLVGSSALTIGAGTKNNSDSAKKIQTFETAINESYIPDHEVEKLQREIFAAMQENIRQEKYHLHTVKRSYGDSQSNDIKEYDAVEMINQDGLHHKALDQLGVDESYITSKEHPKIATTFGIKPGPLSLFERQQHVESIKNTEQNKINNQCQAYLIEHYKEMWTEAYKRAVEQIHSQGKLTGTEWRLNLQNCQGK